MVLVLSCGLLIVAWHLCPQGESPNNLWRGTLPSQQMDMSISSLETRAAHRAEALRAWLPAKNAATAVYLLLTNQELFICCSPIKSSGNMSLLIKTRAGLRFKSIQYDCVKQASVWIESSPERGQGSHQNEICPGAAQNAGNNAPKCRQFITFKERVKEGSIRETTVKIGWIYTYWKEKRKLGMMKFCSWNGKKI